MSKFETEGIVLKQFDLGEADKIITFYTKDNGKVRAVARGVKKPRSKISGLVQLFTYNKITFYKGRSLERINHIENIYPFSSLRNNLNKMAYASYIAEYVEKVGMENNPNPDIFNLLLEAFYNLMKNDNNKLEKINLIFVLRLLKYIGFEPVIDKCIKCNNKIEPAYNNIFDIKQGGLLCEKCFDNSKENIFILNGETLAVMRKFILEGFSASKSLSISNKSKKNLIKFIDYFIIYHLDFKLKSTEFLNMIRDLG